MDHNLGIIILAGGHSRRMGEDKGLIEVKGKAIIQYLIETCQIISKNMIIISNSEHYNVFGYPVYSDIIKNIGPIGGLYTGLHNSVNDWNIVLSCDVPLVSAQLLRKLAESRNEEKFAGVAAHQERIHPTIGLYHKNFIPTIKNVIKQKQYKMSNLYEHPKATIIDCNDFPAKEFLNLNTINELEFFKKHVNGD
ncbi:MAG: molybdenum cofactor guanylyltransferase [Crocinitomicaceae bacterium]